LGAPEANEQIFGTDLRITEVLDRSYASLAGRMGKEATCKSNAEKLLRLTLPEPGGLSDGDGFAAFWMGSDQWMIEAALETSPDLAGDLKLAVGDTGSVTDQTDAWARFDIIGSKAGAMMERLCALDLSAAGDGLASRTLIDHMGCFVIARGGDGVITVMGMRSAAASLHHALCAAAKSVA